MTDVGLVLAKLARLEQQIALARARRPATPEVLSSDLILRDALALSVMVALQEAIDITYHVVADEGGGVPRTAARRRRRLGANGGTARTAARRIRRLGAYGSERRLGAYGGSAHTAANGGSARTADRRIRQRTAARRRRRHGAYGGEQRLGADGCTAHTAANSGSAHTANGCMLQQGANGSPVQTEARRTRDWSTVQQFAQLCSLRGDTDCVDGERWQSVPIYERARRLLVGLGPLAVRLGSHDRELASQLRRASASILLNLAEGAGSSRGTRRSRYESALGSARETLAALHVAQAWAYLRPADDTILDEADHLVAVLVRFVKRT